MFKNPFYKQVAKTTMTVVAIILMTRLSFGVMFGVLGLMGAVYVSRGRTGKMVACFLLIPFMMMVNRVILPGGSMSALLSRIGQVVIVTVVICQISLLKGSVKLPLEWLYVYCLWAFVTSIDGWFPMISYLKLINFCLFFIGIAFAVRQMQKSDTDLNYVRNVMMALAIIMIGGSFILRFIPSVGFSMHAHQLMFDAIGFRAAVAEQGVRLFNGMTWHSQALAPISTMFAVWVLIDMLLVEKKVTALHLGLVCIMPILLYWTSSRTGLVAFSSAMLAIWLYMLPRASLSARTKRHMQSIFMGGLALLVAFAIVSEIRSGTMSKWLRKTATEEDTYRDTRGLLEAVTASRQGLVELNMRDYHLRPMTGMGFQVMEWHRTGYELGEISLWSAPIEKGVLPLMILGETGIVGAVIFVIFLISFTYSMMRRRFVATVTLFWTMMATNMSEATFFSPSGAGGIIWCIAAIGGMCIDVIVMRERMGLRSQ